MVKRAALVLGAASLVYTVAWFLPVVEGGTTLVKGGLPGWEAVQAALSPLWDQDERDPWWRAALAVLSAFTNLWFLFSVAALTRWPVATRALLLWGSLASVLLNAHWFLVEDRSDLRIGYYLWVASFALLAVAASWSTTQRRPSGGLTSA